MSAKVCSILSHFARDRPKLFRFRPTLAQIRPPSYYVWGPILAKADPASAQFVWLWSDLGQFSPKLAHYARFRPNLFRFWLNLILGIGQIKSERLRLCDDFSKLWSSFGRTWALPSEPGSTWAKVCQSSARAGRVETAHSQVALRGPRCE